MNTFESGEDYLERILILSEKNGQVRAIDIANDMAYSRPSVSIALKKLKDNGYIDINDNLITLTELGYLVANKTYERHLYIAKALMKIGVEEEIALKDACKIEHDISEETFQKLKDFV